MAVWTLLELGPHSVVTKLSAPSVKVTMAMDLSIVGMA